MADEDARGPVQLVDTGGWRQQEPAVDGATERRERGRGEEEDAVCRWQCCCAGGAAADNARRAGGGRCYDTGGGGGNSGKQQEGVPDDGAAD